MVYWVHHITCRVLTIQWWCQPTEFVRLSVKSSVLFWGDGRFDIIWHWLSHSIYVSIHCYRGIPCACMYSDAVCINTLYIYIYLHIYYYIIIYSMYIYIYILCTVPSICIYTLYIHLQQLIIKIHSYIEIIEQKTCRTFVLNPTLRTMGAKFGALCRVALNSWKSWNISNLKFDIRLVVWNMNFIFPYIYIYRILGIIIPTDK